MGFEIGDEGTGAVGGSVDFPCALLGVLRLLLEFGDFFVQLFHEGGLGIAGRLLGRDDGFELFDGRGEDGFRIEDFFLDVGDGRFGVRRRDEGGFGMRFDGRGGLRGSRSRLVENEESRTERSGFLMGGGSRDLRGFGRGGGFGGRNVERDDGFGGRGFYGRNRSEGNAGKRAEIET